jgi:DNA-directed RNA polymerase specialized sigma24 family protein
MLMGMMMAFEASTSRAVAEEVDLALVQFGSEMYGLALSIVGNVADAEDAYQTAWVLALSHWRQLRDPSKRRSWLATIAARSALGTRRRHLLWLRRHVPIADAAALSEVMHWDPALAGGLALVTDRQRAVLALHYGHGYSLEETAAILRCRNGTVRSHLARALATLRRTLCDDER